MRVLMITDFYWPYLGGVEQHVRNLSYALAARGYEVAVVTQWHEGLLEFEEDNGLHLYRVRGTLQRATWLFSNAGRPWAPPFPDPQVVVALQRILNKEQPDIVHGHDWLARSFLPLKKRSGAKFVMSLHYYTLSCAKKNLMYGEAQCSGPRLSKCSGCGSKHYGLLKGTGTVLSNWAMSAAECSMVDLFMPVSHATAEGNALKDSRVPFEVIHNFVLDPADIPAGDAAPFLAQLPQEDFLLFVGDLRRHKGLDVLLRAYDNLDNAPPLVLIGKVWAETPTVFPKNVVVFQNWPNYAVLAAWRRCLIALAPSTWPEPCATVVLEAMVAGRPVIATDIGGMPDMVVNDETGLLVPPGDWQALRNGIQRLLDDVPLRKQMGAAAERKAREFQASSIVPRIANAYHTLLRHC